MSCLALPTDLYVDGMDRYDAVAKPQVDAVGAEAESLCKGVAETYCLK